MAVRTLFTVALAAALLAPATAGAAFGPVTDLSSTAPGAISFSASVAMDAQGEATAIWVGPVAGHAVVQAVTHRPGRPWSAPVALSDTQGDAFFPQLAVDESGRATAVWQVGTGDVTSVQAVTRDGRGRWSPPATLAGGGATLPDVAIGRSGATAVWLTRAAGGGTVQVARLDGRGGWSAPTIIAADPDPFAFDDPAIAVDDGGDAVATWGREAGESHALHDEPYVSSWYGRGAWAPPARLADSGVAVPTISRHGVATVLWQPNSSPSPLVSTQVRGGAWSPPQVVPGGATWAFAGAQSGDLVVLGRMPGNDAALTASSRSGRPPLRPGPWSAPELVNPGGPPRVFYPGVTMSPRGDALATWIEYPPDNRWVIRAAIRRGRWAPPQDVAPATTLPPGGRLGSAVGAIDDHGDAAVVWVRDTNAGMVIQGAGT